MQQDSHWVLRDQTREAATPNAPCAPGEEPLFARNDHWSGHSSFSAAGASVLAGFFCDDHVSFTITTDAQKGAPQSNSARTYSSFSDAAAEAEQSRVYGGLHFPYSNRAGLRAGQDIAHEVLAHSLLLEGTATHHGACPV